MVENYSDQSYTWETYYEDACIAVVPKLFSASSQRTGRVATRCRVVVVHETTQPISRSRIDSTHHRPRGTLQIWRSICARGCSIFSIAWNKRFFLFNSHALEISRRTGCSRGRKPPTSRNAASPAAKGTGGRKTPPPPGC